MSLFQDFRYGVRLLVKSPGLSAVVIATLALALAANAVIFSFTDLFLLRPLPLGDPARVIFIYGAEPRRGVDKGPVSALDTLEFRARATSLEQIAAFRELSYTLTGRGDPLRVHAVSATANLFSTWELQAVIGRLFVSGDDAPGAPKVTVLSHRFWMSRFNGDPAILGQSVTLNGEPHAIVGVLTPRIEIGNFVRDDLWVPLSLETSNARRDDRTLRVTARMSAHASFEQTTTEIQAIAASLRQTYPVTNDGWSARPLRLRDAIVGRHTWLVLTLLTIVVSFVLIVACANVANMMLARAVRRRREVALRVALGASRMRLVRQMICESLVMGLAGGAIGVLLGRVGLGLVRDRSGQPFFLGLRLDANVLVYTFALALLAPVLFGLAPAIYGSRADLNRALSGGDSRSSPGVGVRRGHNALVIAQLALAFVLLVVAILAARTVSALEHEASGVNTTNVLTGQLTLDGSKYMNPLDVIRLANRLGDELSAMPGAEAAAVMSSLPLVESESTITFRIEGGPVPDPKDMPWASVVSITADYNRLFDLRVREGRTFSQQDDERSAAVALVSREAARRFWPGTSPVGRYIAVTDSPIVTAARLLIVGVVDDVRSDDQGQSAPPRLYRPFAQAPTRVLAFALRRRDRNADFAPSARQIIRRLDPDLPLSEMRLLGDLVNERNAEGDVLVGMFASFAMLALVLGGTGLYGVAAFGVSQRTREIAIRMALGGKPGSVLRLVLRQHAVVVAAGASLGAVGSLVMARGMRSFLYGVAATDPLTFASTLTIMAMLVAVATSVPAWRASRIPPSEALRHE